MKRTLVLFVFLNFVLQAQDSVFHKTPTAILRFPLADLPFMNYAANTVSDPIKHAGGTDFLRSYSFPGMDKATDFSNDLYTITHYELKKLIKVKNKFLRHYLMNLTCGAADFLFMYSPLGSGWLHEEYHRSMMALHYVKSFSDMNTFPIGQEVVSVHNVYDADLARMKSESNPDFVRMMSAGIEGQYHQIQLLQKDNFYFDQELPNNFLYLMSTINSIYYVKMTSSKKAGALTSAMMNKEGTDITKRDFTGLDFDAWVYDLFRPDEPYSNRGIHPSGIGFKRYISPDDLTTEELNYLKRQGNLQLINAISPMLFGINSIKIKQGSRKNFFFNFALRHLLTSFGSDISTNILFKTPKNNFFFAYHLYQNKNCSFHGLEGELIDKAIKAGRKSILLGSKVMLWTQPENQRFYSYTQQAGGMASLTLDYPVSKCIYIRVSVKTKTQGWVMGETFIDKNTSVTAGIRTNLYR